VTHETDHAQLEQLGFSPAEAQVYLAIVQHGALGAAAIATETGIPRTSVYPTLSSLLRKGVIEGGRGHGSRFVAVSPDEALPALISRERETIAERERIAKELGCSLAAAAGHAEAALDDSVQVIRTPQLIGERLHRLQLEAKRSIEGVVKAPILMPQPWNPAQKQAVKRGVRYKALYERVIVEDERVKPYLAGWIAGGEEARVFDGELPYKLVVFDEEVVLSTLVRRSGQPAALLVRHTPFAQSMSILFKYFWEQAEPLSSGKTRKKPHLANGASHSGKGRTKR